MLETLRQFGCLWCAKLNEILHAQQSSCVYSWALKKIKKNNQFSLWSLCQNNGDYTHIYWFTKIKKKITIYTNCIIIVKVLSHSHNTHVSNLQFCTSFENCPYRTKTLIFLTSVVSHSKYLSWAFKTCYCAQGGN